MAKRIVDGEGVWTSSKLSMVEPPEFRLHYANLIPLAEANGVFEANPRLILVRVYSFLFPDMTVAGVEKILSEFERVGLLVRWEQDGKHWAYFTGIDKSGRLPSEKHLVRYKALPPAPPFRDSPGGAGITPLGFGIGIGMDKEGTPQKKFIPPTVEEVSAYFKQIGYVPQAGDFEDCAQYFIDWHETRGWIPSGQRKQMTSWKAAARTWKYAEKKFSNNKKKGVPELPGYTPRNDRDVPEYRSRDKLESGKISKDDES